MAELICYGWIAFAVLAMIFVLWCVEKWFAAENDARKRRIRDAQRQSIIEYNRQWYIYTRAEDTRSDLVRAWSEVDV